MQRLYGHRRSSTTAKRRAPGGGGARLIWVYDRGRKRPPSPAFDPPLPRQPKRKRRDGNHVRFSVLELPRLPRNLLSLICILEIGGPVFGSEKRIRFSPRRPADP